MRLPAPRGPQSAAVIAALRDGDSDVTADAPDAAGLIDPLSDDDFQLALWTLYELHYDGFDDVPDEREWDPGLLAVRRDLETVFVSALREEAVVPPDSRPVADRLRGLVEAEDGPSVSRYLQTEADRDQFLEFLVHRSLYQLKEADPHSWALPRLRGRAKAALVEIQTDEYGDGDPARMHSQLFRVALSEVGLDDRYGAYVDRVPGVTLALSNVMSLFGLHRQHRGALVGHLAAYEMTSSEPCRRYAKGLRRLGGSEAACAFFDVHVTADALHEQLAAHDLCGGLSAEQPDLTEDIVFGAAACLAVDRRFGRHVLDCWNAGRSSLRRADHLLAAG